MLDRPGLTETDAEVLSRVLSFLEPFRAYFRRQDQLRRAAAYLSGLLLPGARKNIETLARSFAAPPGWDIRDPAQALQHFIDQSPWDGDGVRGHYLRTLAGPLADPGGVLAFEEQTFPKQGRRSVGVHRQYSSALGRKLNCQVAIAMHHATPDRFLPLGVRLYLPRGWVQDDDRLRAAGVPESARGMTKTEIALSLLDAARAAGIPARGVAVGVNVGLGEALREGVESRGLAWLGPLNAELADVVSEGNRMLSRLGLDHFEGRSWRGFHHHTCLVLLAHALH